MKTKENQHPKRSRTPFVGIALAGAALAASAVAGVGSAGADGAGGHATAVDRVGVERAAPDVRVGQTSSGLERAARRPVNYVTVTDALLRARPNRHSTKLDVSQRGRGLTLYCWVHGGVGDGGLVWFKTHPWGSRFTGWMRADLLHWGSYPRPGRC